MTTEELIARLEVATGPCRELDAEIALARGWSQSGIKGNMWAPPGRELWDCDKLPDYTSSIDDALTLVPEGLRWRVSYAPVYQFASASVSDGSILSPNTKEWEGKHTTPASALCIAALKAGEKE